LKINFFDLELDNQVLFQPILFSEIIYQILFFNKPWQASLAPLGSKAQILVSVISTDLIFENLVAQ